MKITIAGASGFIGKNLIKQIDSSHSLNCLSRQNKQGHNNVSWTQSDLFSYQSISNALRDTDIAIYLVHSMLPTSRLFQGNFQDTDLFIADNFARACVQNNVKQIIYLGGLVPEKSTSKHLESRKEVEEVFSATGIPTTILRAGMVVGDGGSSFEILKNLVLNLPAMVLPKWTKSVTQAIYIDDLVRVIKFCIGNTQAYNTTIPVVNGEKITYQKLIRDCAQYFSGNKLLIPVPINYTSFSKLWVRIFGETDYELVSPLIDSLLCDLPTPDVPALIDAQVKFRSFEQMLTQIPKEKRIAHKKRKVASSNTVRSIQRLSNSRNLSVMDISKEYVHWLPLHMKNFVKATWKGHNLCFYIAGLSKPLLQLHMQETIEELNRVKFHIVGGLLTKTQDTGWLEFRKVAGGKYTLVSINNFIPSLPWYIYKYTQAYMHLLVMLSFSKHLGQLNHTANS